MNDVSQSVVKKKGAPRNNPNPSRMTRELSKKELITFYRSLVHNGFSQAAAEIGLDRIYPNKATLRIKGYQIYKSIVPSELGISHDVVELVQKSIQSRKGGFARNTQELDGLSNPGDIIDPSDTKNVILGGRNKAAMLLHKKMDRLNKSKKLLDGVTLTQLATTFGIFFDKAQILTGQATENIQMLAKIKSDMSPEESLDALLKMREVSDNND